VRHTNAQRGEHVRFYNTNYAGGPLFRAALGNDARANGDGFVWDKFDRYWWVSIDNAIRYIAGPDREPLTEEDITNELLEDVVRSATSEESDD
jgi:hypothetical protein